MTSKNGSALPEVGLLRAAFVSLSDHLDREDLVESLVIGDAVECLLVGAAESNRDEIDRRWDSAEDLSVGTDDLNVLAGSRVYTAGGVYCCTVITDHGELALVGERTVGL